MKSKYVLYSHINHKFYGAENGLTDDISKAYTISGVGNALKLSSTLDKELKFKIYPI